MDRLVYDPRGERSRVRAITPQEYSRFKGMDAGFPEEPTAQQLRDLLGVVPLQSAMRALRAAARIAVSARDQPKVGGVVNHEEDRAREALRAWLAVWKQRRSKPAPVKVGGYPNAHATEELGVMFGVFPALG